MIWLFLLLFSDPASFEVRMKEGAAALQRGDVPAAREAFQAAIKLNEQNPGAWLMLAQTLAANDPQAARQAAGRAENLGHDDPLILQALANFYAGVLPDLASAARLGEQYAEKVPQDHAAWPKVAALYLELGRSDDAIRTASLGLKQEETAELHLLLGRALLERKDFSAAHAEFDSAIRLNPYDEDARFRNAQAYLLRQDFVHAAAALEDAKKVFARSPQIELALGVAYYGQRKFEKAVDQFLQTMRLAPDIPQPYVFLGKILEHAGDHLPEIADRFSRFRERNPNNPLGFVLHAKALIAELPASGNTEQADLAMSMLQKALQMQDTSAEAHYLTGVLLERKREFPRAATELERSIQLNAEDSAAHFRLARVYDRLGRREDAERERALHEKLSEAEKAVAR